MSLEEERGPCKQRRATQYNGSDRSIL